MAKIIMILLREKERAGKTRKSSNRKRKPNTITILAIITAARKTPKAASRSRTCR